MEDPRDEIADYLNDRMLPKERHAFESLLASDAELAEAVHDVAQIQAAFEIEAQIGDGHISGEQMALFAERNPSLTDEDHRAIEEHLRECPDCRPEYEQCRRVVQNEPMSSVPGRTEARPRRFAFQPIAAVAAAVAILLVSYLFVQEITDRVPPTAVRELTAGTERSIETSNLLKVPKQTDTLLLQLLVPTIEGSYYDYTLLDAGGTEVFTHPKQPHQLPVAFEVPTVYLQDGRYTIWVIETQGTDPTEPRDSLSVSFSLEFVP